MVAFTICLYFSSLHVNIPDNLYTYGIGHVALYHTSVEFYKSLCDFEQGGREGEWNQASLSACSLFKCSFSQNPQIR